MRILSIAVLPLALVAALPALGCGGGAGNTQPDGQDCTVDTDGDGTPDCEDLDDDDDGLSDSEEETLGTDPLDPDSDRDGIDDATEVNLDRTYSPGGAFALAVTRTDPTVPTLLVEFDYVDGSAPNMPVYQIAEDAFAEAGMEIFFWIDTRIMTSALPVGGGAWTWSDMETLLSNSDDPAAEVHNAYLHMIVAPTDNTTKHGTTHHASPNDPARGSRGNEPDPKVSGAFVFIDTIVTEYNTYASAFGAASITADQLVARTLIHEIGHQLGCTEEGGTIDTHNIMAQNSALGNPNSSITPWEDNIFGLDDVGHPTFSEGSLAQMDLTMKSSVELGTSPSRRNFDMGSSTSPIRTNYFQVTSTTAFVEDIGYGWESPLPTVESNAGSDPSNDRTTDYVAGDLAETAPTRFRVAGLGTGRVSVQFRLGAQVSNPLEVRCELRHPTLGVAFRSGTIDASTQSLTFNGTVTPVVESTNALGYERADLVLDCLDDDMWDDAPIEYITFAKREP